MSDCCNRKTVRNEAEITRLTSRLKKIEGQIRGLQKMLEEDRYCLDIINQTSAIESALGSFKKELLVSHIKHCVVEDIRNDSDVSVDELCDLLRKTI
jgi:DNA-binding FrmR family transcriptional regulator